MVPESANLAFSVCCQYLFKTSKIGVSVKLPCFWTCQVILGQNLTIFALRFWSQRLSLEPAVCFNPEPHSSASTVTCSFTTPVVTSTHQYLCGTEFCVSAYIILRSYDGDGDGSFGILLASFLVSIFGRHTKCAEAQNWLLIPLLHQGTYFSVMKGDLFMMDNKCYMGSFPSCYFHTYVRTHKAHSHYIEFIALTFW